MTSACFLPAAEPEKWRRYRIDWPGAARMAAARRAAGAELDDTDREALRRDEAPAEARATATITTTTIARKPRCSDVT